MEIRDFCIKILSAETLEDKLFTPDELTDCAPGAPLIFKEPARPPGMSFQKRKKEEKLPSFQEHKDPFKRAVCLHRFAGHELLAVEIMAYCLLAFPDTPGSFRKGVAHILKEEQGHVRLYVDQLKKMGLNFGDLPLYRHFWMHTPFITSPLHYVSMMSMTFEMANLDFAPLYGQSFLKAGDEEAAQLMAIILRDEIMHVRFGWQWLKKLKETSQSEWSAWEKVLSSTLLTPKRARGFLFNQEPRFKAGISEEFIDSLKASTNIKKVEKINAHNRN